MSLSAQNPVGTIETTCTTRPVRKVTVSHIFKIMGYSLEKDTDKGTCLTSTIFRVGEHDWNIEYYPNGDTKAEKGYASIFLHLKSEATECVKAQIRFTVVDQTGSGLPAISKKTEVMNFNTGRFVTWGFSFAKQMDLESRIKDDCLVIESSITVFKELPVEQTAPIVVPPANMPHQLGLLLETGTGVDVTFEVNGNNFSAHKCILAARSPVFSAQFFGPMMKKSDTVIQIEEIEVPVFKALLHFIYTDSFPGPDEEINGNEEKHDTQLITQHLLVAADRYNVERLKIVCEKMLCDSIEKSNVITLLTLAERHSCNHLRSACVKLLGSPGVLEAVAETEQFQFLLGSRHLVLKGL